MLLVAQSVLSVGSEPAWDTVMYGSVGFVLVVCGLLIVSKLPRNRIGRLLCAMGFSALYVEVTEGWALHATDGWWGAGFSAWLTSWGWLLTGFGYFLVFLTFPTGRLPSRRWRPVLWACAAGVVLAIVGIAFQAGGDLYRGERNPFAVDAIPADALFGIGMALFTVGLVAAIVSLFVRFGRSAGIERQQLKWLVFAASVALVVLPIDAVYWYSTPALAWITGVTFVLISAAACVAILRHRLYDIDVVINRTLLYAALTASLALIYAAITLVLGTVLGNGAGWKTAAATLAVGLGFRPLRAGLQEIVDRRFSRARYDAKHLIATFLEDVRVGRAEPEGVEALLRDVLDETRLELRYHLRASDEYVDAFGQPLPDATGDERTVTPVERSGVALGLLLHAPAAEGRPGILREVVEQAGLAIEIVGLRVELRRQLEEVEASRARIVAAGYEARRHIERDIHDGAQQRLVSVGLALRHAQHELGASPDGVGPLLDSAVGEIARAIEDLRELASGVRPAALNDGLAPALRDLAAHVAVPVQLDVCSDRLPDDLEAAAYFIASEGLTNAVKHAAASQVVVTVRRDAGRLFVSVHDDGVGGASGVTGSGLDGLADRVAAHGGTLAIRSPAQAGTELRAELPCAS